MPTPGTYLGIGFAFWGLNTLVVCGYFSHAHGINNLAAVQIPVQNVA